MPHNKINSKWFTVYLFQGLPLSILHLSISSSGIYSISHDLDYFPASENSQIWYQVFLSDPTIVYPAEVLRSSWAWDNILVQGQGQVNYFLFIITWSFWQQSVGAGRRAIKYLCSSSHITRNLFWCKFE